jgi:very-short-patch-repair endonuclease
MSSEIFCKCGCGEKIKPSKNSKKFKYGHFKIYMQKMMLVTKECECGCGNKITINCKGEFTRFIHGHNKGMLNKHHTIETKEKIGTKSKEMFTVPEFKEKFITTMKQISGTTEARQKNSETQNKPEVKARVIAGLKKYYSIPENRQALSEKQKQVQNRPEVKAKRNKTINNPEYKAKNKIKMQEVSNRPEVKEKRRAGVKKAYENPETIAHLKAAMNKPEVHEKWVKTFLKNVEQGKTKPAKVFNTRPELLIQEALIKKGCVLKETLIHQFHCKKVGMVDFYLPKENLLIEIDGDYWHCRPTKFVSNYYHKQLKMTAQQVWDRDKRKTEECLRQGYKIIRLWECDVYDNIELCLQKIIEEILK